MGQWEMNRDQTIADLNGVLILCKNFFDWDECNEKCQLCQMCNIINEIHDFNQLEKEHKIMSQLFKVREPEI